MSKTTQKQRPRSFSSPSHLLFYTEPLRAALDLAALAPSYAPLRQTAPKGDGHAVLVLPGFMAGDPSTYILRQFLKSLGYKSYGWELGSNTGPRYRLFAQMEKLMEELADEHGGKISVIGQSLGGIYARELARDKPELVRQVISLGAPFGGMTKVRPSVRTLFQSISGMRPKTAPEQYRAMFKRLPDPLSVPASAVYSKYDGVTHWRSCVQKISPPAPAGLKMENVEVVCSHVGMAVNPSALYMIADRLAQQEGEWKPFNPSGIGSFVYPEPEPLIAAG